MSSLSFKFILSIDGIESNHMDRLLQRYLQRQTINITADRGTLVNPHYMRNMPEGIDNAADSASAYIYKRMSGHPIAKLEPEFYTVAGW